MDIKQLKYFVTVVDMKSFSRAAEHLFISQSALSKVIGNLEREYGVQLLYFLGRQMHLTSYGMQLYAMAQNLIRQYDAINEVMQGAFPQEKGVIRIGFSYILGPSVFPGLAASFLEKYPGIEFVIEQRSGLQDIQNMVHTQQLDVGFVVMPVLADAFEIVPIRKSQFVFVTSIKNPLAQRKSVRFADLKDEQFIMFPQDFRICQEFLAGCRMAKFEPRIMTHLTHWDLIFKLVKLNMGSSFLVQTLLDAFPDDELVSIPVVDALSEWDAVMITAKNRYEPNSLKMFKEHVREKVETGYSWEP